MQTNDGNSFSFISVERPVEFFPKNTETFCNILLFFPPNYRAIDRLLKVIKTPHPVPEICRKAATVLESLVSEPQNRALLLAYENAFAEILFSDGRYSDTFARILYELTSRPNNKVAAAQCVWGM